MRAASPSDGTGGWPGSLGTPARVWARGWHPNPGSKELSSAHGCSTTEQRAWSLTPAETGRQELALFDLTFPWVIASSLQGTAL